MRSSTVQSPVPCPTRQPPPRRSASRCPPHDSASRKLPPRAADVAACAHRQPSPAHPPQGFGEIFGLSTKTRVSPSIATRSISAPTARKVSRDNPVTVAPQMLFSSALAAAAQRKRNSKLRQSLERPRNRPARLHIIQGAPILARSPRGQAVLLRIIHFQPDVFHSDMRIL